MRWFLPKIKRAKLKGIINTCYGLKFLNVSLDKHPSLSKSIWYSRYCVKSTAMKRSNGKLWKACWILLALPVSLTNCAILGKLFNISGLNFYPLKARRVDKLRFILLSKPNIPLIYQIKERLYVWIVPQLRAHLKMGELRRGDGITGWITWNSK